MTLWAECNLLVLWLKAKSVSTMVSRGFMYVCTSMDETFKVIANMSPSGGRYNESCCALELFGWKAYSAGACVHSGTRSCSSKMSSMTRSSCSNSCNIGWMSQLPQVPLQIKDFRRKDIRADNQSDADQSRCEGLILIILQLCSGQGEAHRDLLGSLLYIVMEYSALCNRSP